MTAFRPGASPPPVEMAMRMSAWALDQSARSPPAAAWRRRGLLREHQVAVHCHLEDSAGGRHQPDFGVGELLLQLSRQTGGSGLVVSDDAVFDDDPHAVLLSNGMGAAGIVVLPGGETKGARPERDAAPCQAPPETVSI